MSNIDPVDPRIIDPNLLNNCFLNENQSGRSLVWLGHQPATINWKEYRTFLSKKYGPQYASMQFNYAHRYVDFLKNPFKLQSLSSSKKINVMKALVCLSKYLGIYLDFKDKLKQHGIKWTTTDSFDSFLRMFNNKSSNVLEWYRKAYTCLPSNEKLYLRFILLSGIRKSEGIEAFNLVIDLHNESRENEYYNSELEILQHFRFKQFLRNSKNVYISIVAKDLILQMENSSKVSHSAIRKRLNRNGLRLRFKELRQYYATFMVRHNLIREEVDLLQGRVPKSIFIRHYWSPSFKELRDRTLEALKQLEQSL